MKRLGMEAFSSPSTNANATITGDGLGVDDFLDFSFKDGFLDMITGNNYYHPLPSLVAESNVFDSTFSALTSNDFWKPNEDIMDLEWISKFVEESFSEVPFQYSSDAKNISKMNTGTPLASNNITFNNQSCRPRSKRPRVSIPPTHITSFSQTSTSNSTSSSETNGSVRKCSHCASEKTPQWRTGPLGPKTLCNACGVRYKSGRLVPEYRPAASPTFVLTQHSNSHRKVMELRRQKELHFNHRLHNHHHPQFSTSTDTTTMSNANTHSNFLLC